MLPLVLLLATVPDAPSRTCSSYVLHHSPNEIAADAALIGKAAGARTLPKTITAVMGAGEWQIIWAAPDDREDGVFFFKGHTPRPNLVDVWGGMTTDRKGAARWAIKLGVPTALAQCFAARLVAKGP